MPPGLFKDGPAEVRMSGGLAVVGLSIFELDAPPDIASFEGFSLSSSSCNRFPGTSSVQPVFLFSPMQALNPGFFAKKLVYRQPVGSLPLTSIVGSSIKCLTSFILLVNWTTSSRVSYISAGRHGAVMMMVVAFNS